MMDLSEKQIEELEVLAANGMSPADISRYMILDKVKLMDALVDPSSEVYQAFKRGQHLSATPITNIDSKTDDHNV